ncbi:MAG TPA: hypothetical protein VFS10_17380 [Pyrinomonadaceae bacterium]|nr:hypothetical protein [Pyrinomonadaceae bacterium]
MKLKQVWLAIAGLFLLAALFFLWRGLTDATFVCAALGVVAWFLNIRAQLRRNLPEEEEEEEVVEDESEDVGERELRVVFGVVLAAGRARVRAVEGVAHGLEVEADEAGRDAD